MYWPPKNNVIKRVEKKIAIGKHKNGRIKYKKEHQCEECLQWFPETLNGKGKLTPDVHIDHQIPVGGFSEDITKWAEDLAKMYQRTFVTEEHLKALCVECHQKKTNKENEERRSK